MLKKMKTPSNSTQTPRAWSSRTKRWTPGRLVVMAASLVACVASAQSPVTVSSTPTADAFVRSADPTHNYGGGGALSVSGSAAVNGSGQQNGSFDSLMRFSLNGAVSSFDAAFGAGNWTLSSAKLWLTEVAAPTSTMFNRGVGSFEVRWMANDGWGEGTGTPSAPTTDGVTYKDLPSLTPVASTVSLGTFANAGQNTQQAFALPLNDSTFLSDLMSGGSVSFYLTAASPGVGFTFNSRSFGTVSGRPFLEVTAVPEPGVTALLALGGLGLVGRRVWRRSRGNERH